MKWPEHGANPHYVYAFFGMKIPEEHLDFSTNVNPSGMPAEIVELWPTWLSAASDYPDPKQRLLKELIAKRNDVSSDSVLVGNGGAELISLLGSILRGKRVLIVQPTFSEYEIACRANGCTVFHHVLREESWEFSAPALVDRIDEVRAEAVFFCTPNNPTGVAYDEIAVETLVHACQQRQITVVIDEAFFDFQLDERSYVNLLEHATGLVILRSLTKMYAIAGLRLGYLLAHPEKIRQLTSFQAHWSVNGIALQAGAVCLKAENHVQASVASIEEERVRLFSFLKKNGFVVSPSRVNFYVLREARTEDVLPLFRFLLKKGIVPRHTANFPGLDGKWLRFAIKKRAENDLLMEALTEWRKENSFL